MCFHPCEPWKVNTNVLNDKLFTPYIRKVTLEIISDNGRRRKNLRYSIPFPFFTFLRLTRKSRWVEGNQDERKRGGERIYEKRLPSLNTSI
jgi:hypothetical protein